MISYLEKKIIHHMRCRRALSLRSLLCLYLSYYWTMSYELSDRFSHFPSRKFLSHFTALHMCNNINGFLHLSFAPPLSCPLLFPSCYYLCSYNILSTLDNEGVNIRVYNIYHSDTILFMRRNRRKSKRGRATKTSIKCNKKLKAE